MSTHRPRAVVYARISEDASGEAAGVRRQVAACVELCEARGWEVVAECTDNDISALRGRLRPGYEHVLNLVRADEVDHVVVWQTSRLLRNRRERAEAIELFGRKRVGIITVKGQDLDLSSAYGRGMAGMLGEFDTMESEVKSERVAAASADRAASGRPNAGLGYGWTKDASGAFVEDVDQADVVREVTRRLLAGETLLGVTRDLNERGVPAPASAAWGKTSVKKLALRPSNAGVRVHHRGRATEREYDGNWPALVRFEDWRAVRDLLSAPQRQTNGVARPGARKHLLTWGIGECGVCGARLRVALKGHAQYGRKKHLYVCEARGCVGRDEARVDELVSAVVVARLAQPDALSWLAGDEDAAREASDRSAALRARLDDAADRYADDKITLQQLERITEKLRPQIEASDRESIAARPALASLLDIAGPAAQERWSEMGLARRRAVLDTLGVRVRIMPVTRRGPGFDPESVQIEWR